MGHTKCEYNWQNTGRQVFYDGSTFETLMNSYPVQYVEDFAGNTAILSDGTTIWTALDVGANGTTAQVADQHQWLLHLTADSEAQDQGIYHGDNRTFDVGAGLIFEARVDMAVAPGTGVRAVFGMCGDHALDKDAITESAWFSFDASMVGDAETDDTTNDTSAATGNTAVAGTYDIYRIDFTTLADVKFFINGVRVAASTTFDMSNLSASEQQMQPYFMIDKPSGTSLGDVNIDYVKIFSNR